MSDCDGTQIEDLAATYGTPLYVYDGDLIGQRIERVLESLSYRPLRLFYSAKANPAVAIAALMREYGIGLDACSPGDLHLAQLAGFIPEEISYTGYGATDAELASAYAASATVVVDSVDELERIGRRHLGLSVGIRVNPGVRAGFHEHVAAGAASAKFGVPLAELDEARAVADSYGLRLAGLHAHIGSDVLDPEKHISVLRLLGERAGGLDWINLGGGWGTPRRSSGPVYEWNVFDQAAHELLPPGVELRIEPGGYLTMDAGWLVTRVVRIEQGRGERPATVVVDANTNHLVSALLYRAHHPVTNFRGVGEPAPFRIVGNLMQAADVLLDDVQLPTPTAGDLLALGHVGAYASSRATTFNERPRPAEILVRNGRQSLIRRRETVEDLFAKDLLPRM
jgi:diaminopimelate decarboxylase